MSNTPYNLGQLLSVLIADGCAKEHDLSRISPNPSIVLNHAIAEAARNRGRIPTRERIAPMMEEISEVPTSLTPEEWGNFWLGFYAGRSGARQAKENGDGLTKRFEMKLSPEQKDWLMANGGAAKVRELIDAARQ